jgi:hypothetical protein
MGSGIMVLHKTGYTINDKIQVEMSETRMSFHDIVDVMNQEFEAFIMSDKQVGLVVPLQPLWMKNSKKMGDITSCKQMATQHNLVVNEILRNETCQEKLIILTFPTAVNNCHYFKFHHLRHSKQSMQIKQ